MKLVIQVSEDAADATAEPTDAARGMISTPEEHPEIEVMDGGPVPEILLSMESEVAAGQRAAPRSW